VLFTVVAVVAECPVALVTSDHRLKTGRLVTAEAVVTYLQVALFTDTPLFAPNTVGLPTIFTDECLFTLTTGCRLASYAIFELFTAVAECLFTLATYAQILAFETQ
jgi:hypothetical protein